MSRAQFEEAGLVVLADSEEAGVHLAVSPDLFRIVYFQGHPEYDRNSLLKEYKRECRRHLDGERGVPPFPERYFSPQARRIAGHYLERARAAGAEGRARPEFPEAELLPFVDNTWRDTGKAIVNNWLGLVYRLTDLDRKIPFMDGVNPNDPLGLLG